MTTKQKLTILLLFILPAFGAAQQPQQQQQQQSQQQQRRNWPQRGQNNQQPRFDPQQFQQMMLMTITREAGFTQAESQSFMPLYKEMREKQRVLSGQIHELKTKKYSSEKEYLNALTKIKSLQVEVAEVEADYYKRLCKAVGAEKMFKLMQAEDKFHRQMVRGGNQHQWQQRPQGQNQWQRPQGQNQWNRRPTGEKREK